MGDQVRRAADTLPFIRALSDLAVEDPVAALQATVKLRAAIADTEALAVASARQKRLTWGEIAGPIGLPVSTAHRHFRHLDRSGRRRPKAS